MKAGVEAQEVRLPAQLTLRHTTRSSGGNKHTPLTENIRVSNETYTLHTHLERWAKEESVIISEDAL